MQILGSGLTVGQTAENRVLWFVFTFVIKMNECPFNFSKFLDVYLERLSDGVSFF